MHWQKATADTITRKLFSSAVQCRGSLFELIDHLIIANDEGYLSSKDYQMVRTQIDKAIQLVNGYIRYLQTRKNR